MIIDILLLLIALYLFLGFIFVIAFLIKGIDLVDEGAHGSTFGFKLIIIPGVIVFWPVLMKKWLIAKNKKR